MPQAFPKKPSSPTNAVVVEHVPHTPTTQSYLPAIVTGLGVSMKHFFKNTKEMLLVERPDPSL